MTTSRPDTREAKHAAVFAAIAEVLFVLLPLLVLSIVLLLFRQSTWRHLLVSPEWSFAAAILFGQSIVKVVLYVGRRGMKSGDSYVASAVAALIVLGLVPSLTVLTLILSTDESESGFSLLVAQQCLLFGALIAFVAVCVVFQPSTSRQWCGSQSHPDRAKPSEGSLT